MPRNSQELTQIAGQWANTVKNDIRTQMINFIESSHLTEEQVAEMFALTMGELEQILRGNGECTITTLTKLLIMTGNTLEIKPIEQSTLGSYNNVDPHHQHPQNNPRRAPQAPAGHAPRTPMGRAPHAPMGRAPHAPVGAPGSGFGFDSKGRPLPDPKELFGRNMPAPGHEPSQAKMDRMLDEYWARKNGGNTQMPYYQQQPAAPQQPQRDSRGRFTKKGGMQHMPMQPQAPFEPHPEHRSVEEVGHENYNAMDRQTLVNLIVNNLWDSEIDVNTATIEQLAAFMNAKAARLNNMHSKPNRQPAAAPQQPAPAPQQGGDDIENFANAMRSFVEQNPQLRETMKSIFG